MRNFLFSISLLQLSLVWFMAGPSFASISGVTPLAGPGRAEMDRRTYADLRAEMKDIVNRIAPGVANSISLGVSDSGLPIEGVKFGNGQTHTLVVATHHGNEYGSTEVARALLHSLAEAPLADQTVYVIPVLNITGYNQRSRYESNANGQGRDPNRDYPGPCGTQGPFKLKSTKLLADFLDREKIVSSATLHTFYPGVVYPWGISSHDLATDYTDLFKMLTQAATAESGYPTGNGSEVIYPADGTFEDYAFWKHGIWSLLYELGHSHHPDESSVSEMQRVNIPGIRRALAQSPRERAARHDFKGKCDVALRALDLGNE
jgi:carboxypeptidase T